MSTEECVYFGCTRLSEPGCFMQDPETQDDLPACVEHDQDAEHGELLDLERSVEEFLLRNREEVGQ